MPAGEVSTVASAAIRRRFAADGPPVTRTGAPPSSSRESTDVPSSTFAEPRGPASSAASASISVPIPLRRVKKFGVLDQEDESGARCAARAATTATARRLPRSAVRRPPLEAIGAAGVDATDQRVDEPFEHFAAETPLDERAERVGLTRAARQQWLDRRSRQPTGAQHSRARDGDELDWHAEREPCGQSAQRPRDHT